MRDRMRGVFTALVTPFDRDDALDERALRRLVRRQLEAGVAGIAAGATTGESATLEPGEHQDLVRAVAEEVQGGGGDAAVLAGVSVSSTRRACELARRFRDAGADGLLVATPPYNKPPQRGLADHFRAVADAGELPVVLYNVPSRTAVNLEAETVLELAGDARFVGIKEASGRMDQVSEILRRRPGDFAVLSGDDLFTLPILALGGDGVVAVISNQAPGLMVELVEAALAGDRGRAASLHARLLPLMQANFVETNPVPVKWSLQRMGLIGRHLRPPLSPLAAQHEAKLEEALASVGLSGGRGAAGGAGVDAGAASTDRRATLGGAAGGGAAAREAAVDGARTAAGEEEG